MVFERCCGNCTEYETEETDKCVECLIAGGYKEFKLNYKLKEIERLAIIGKKLEYAIDNNLPFIQCKNTEEEMEYIERRDIENLINIVDINL